ncbi:MAG: conjugal transfer protein, partial [Caulobacteraceae bacterium]
MPVPGFEIPLHGALAEPITIAGAPRTAVILIGTLTAVLSLG